MRLSIFSSLLCIGLLSVASQSSISSAAQPVDVWPDLAPLETSRETGTVQPNRPSENPPVTRVTNIRRPTMDVFLPPNPCGTAVVILPGGGYGKVVTNKEGSEAALWMNELGITSFVLRYRTNENNQKDEPGYLRPLQDAQRAVRLVRSRADLWKINKDRVGILAFSAGGQVGAVLHTAIKPAYDAVDEIDEQAFSPAFSMLVYPWRVTDSDGNLADEIQVTKDSPPVFLVHTHDDNSTSLGSVLIYAAHKKAGVPAELHVYQNGGHGYGMRQVSGSDVDTWPARATDWLVNRKLGIR